MTCMLTLRCAWTASDDDRCWRTKSVEHSLIWMAKAEVSEWRPNGHGAASSLPSLRRLLTARPARSLMCLVQVETMDKEGNPIKSTFDFVPPQVPACCDSAAGACQLSARHPPTLPPLVLTGGGVARALALQVLGGVSYAAEPNWSALQQMSYMEFYAGECGAVWQLSARRGALQCPPRRRARPPTPTRPAPPRPPPPRLRRPGLRARNWTSPHYDPEAQPWSLQFFRDRRAVGGHAGEAAVRGQLGYMQQGHQRGRGAQGGSSWRGGAHKAGAAPLRNEAGTAAKLQAAAAQRRLQDCGSGGGGGWGTRPAWWRRREADPVDTCAPPPNTHIHTLSHHTHAPTHPPPCSGRLLRPSWDGYRVLVQPTAPDGAPDGPAAWVNLDRAGADAFLRDYSGGGSAGGLWVGKRERRDLGSPAMYGYNQVGAGRWGGCVGAGQPGAGSRQAATSV